MSNINYAELKSLYEGLGPQKANVLLRESLASGNLNCMDFSLNALAREMVSEEWLVSLDPRGAGFVPILEDVGGVSTTAFSNITGQLVFSMILQGYESPEFIGTRLSRNVPTRLSGERIPGITRIGDEAKIVKEGMPYPSAGVGEEYIDTPETDKRGLIVPVTREAIFFDRTNLLADRARKVGEWLGVNKEKRILQVVLGITNNYKRNGTALNTYLTTGAYINEGTTDLTDWEDIETALLLFDDLIDPDTLEPIIIGGRMLLTASRKLMTGRRILTATQVRHGDGGSTLPQTIGSNPLAGFDGPVSSPYVKKLLTDAGQASPEFVWLLGDFQKAFAYMENWPITVTQAPSNSEAEFVQDVVLRFKASERGVAAVLEPRAVVRELGTA